MLVAIRVVHGQLTESIDRSIDQSIDRSTSSGQLSVNLKKTFGHFFQNFGNFFQNFGHFYSKFWSFFQNFVQFIKIYNIFSQFDHFFQNLCHFFIILKEKLQIIEINGQNVDHFLQNFRTLLKLRKIVQKPIVHIYYTVNWIFSIWPQLTNLTGQLTGQLTAIIFDGQMNNPSVPFFTWTTSWWAARAWYSTRAVSDSERTRHTDSTNTTRQRWSRTADCE